MSCEGIVNSLHLKSVEDQTKVGCGATDESGAVCGETENLGILEQFQKIYAERMKRLEGDNELAMNTLKSWVHDLTEQNALLVHTVEELERELLKRVDLMHDQLQKTNVAIKRKELCARNEKNAVESALHQQVQLLQSDVATLLEIIDQACQEGRCTVDNLKLHTVNRHHVLTSAGPNRTSDAPPQPVGVAGDSQKDLKVVVDNLKTELAAREAEIHSYMEHIEEMQNVLALSSQQVKLAVQAEKKSMQHMVTKHACESLSSPTKSLERDPQDKACWLWERMRQQQEQVSLLTSRLHELETNLEIMRSERDCLTKELQCMQLARPSFSQTQTQTPVDSTLLMVNSELEATRLQLAQAKEHAQSLTTLIQKSEKANRETQAALTVEVAEKHDQIRTLRRELQQQEEQIRQAYMQTQFKDNIILELRKDLKRARNKIHPDNGADCDSSKSRRLAFPPIPETGSVNDSGVDDGDTSVSSQCSLAEVDSLRSRTLAQQKQLCAKEQELASLKDKIVIVEKELVAQQRISSKTAPPPPPVLTLRELEEYRLCTVEAQAAVEELKDEIEEILSDIRAQELKMENLEDTVRSSLETLHNAQTRVSEALLNPSAAVTNELIRSLSNAKECIEEIHFKAEDYITERQNSKQLRSSRDRKVDKLQEQLDGSHDNMRDGIETMEQSLAERYEADRLSQRDLSDGSSYHSCRDSDSSTYIKQQNERLEERNAELLSNLATSENLKRDVEAKATHYIREIERMREQLGGKAFAEEMLHTKDKLIHELQGTVESTRRQLCEMQQEIERTTRERDNLKHIVEQGASKAPLQVAELQSEVALLRHQLSTLAAKQTLVEQYEHRLQESSEQTEKLGAQLNTLTLNLHAKEKMLANKEEMVTILQDTLDRTREEMKAIKDKSRGAGSGTEKVGANEDRSGANGGVSDEVSGSSGVWGWARNTARKHRVHDV